MRPSQHQSASPFVGCTGAVKDTVVPPAARLRDAGCVETEPGIRRLQAGDVRQETLRAKDKAPGSLSMLKYQSACRRGLSTRRAATGSFPPSAPHRRGGVYVTLWKATTLAPSVISTMAARPRAPSGRPGGPRRMLPNMISPSRSRKRGAVGVFEGMCFDETGAVGAISMIFLRF